MATTDRAVESKAGLIQGLGLVDSTTLVMGSMIGSGIFIVSADVARQVRSPGLLILVWLVSAVLTVIAALSYGELAAAMPHAGGQYVYLREALGPLSGFLYGWTLFLVIQTGTIAAVAVGFAKFSGVFFPWISATNIILPGLSTQRLVGILLLISLSAVNCLGIRTGATIQNIFTVAKTASLLGLVVLGFALGSNPQAVQQNFAGFWSGASLSFESLRFVAVGMVGALFAADAWNNVTFTAGEVKNPRRNLPLSLALGTGLVLALYVATNFVYLRWLPLDPAIQHAAEDRVATATVQAMLGGNAERLMALAIMVSTFGCMNGLILAGARVYYAMARDGLFFRRVGDIHPRYHTPVASLAVQCVWACLLTLSGTYNDLLDYVIFAVLLFYILTIAGLFVLRRRRPEMERPYLAWGYPWAPAFYIVVAVYIEVMLLLYKPGYTFPGLVIVLLGVPVYYFWRRRGT
ncbi:MAG: amino acid permease [Acidobacteria bacterium]|nr:amino acid permease [Acidobacteriota bacterium]